MNAVTVMLRRSFISTVACVLAVAARSVTASVCPWTDPGHDPYMLSVPAAVDAYTDIPLSARERLKLRMGRHHYDDFVAITRLGVQGGYVNLRDMHFGTGRLCRGTVDTSGWPDHATERGLVYCVQEHCVIVPTVCRNVSRVDRVPPSGRVLDIPGGFASEMFWQPSGDGSDDPLTDTPDTLVRGGGEITLAWQWDTDETTGDHEDGGEIWPTVYPPRSMVLPPMGVPFSVRLPPVGTAGGDMTISRYAAPIPEVSTFNLVVVGLCVVLICAYVSRRRQQ